MTFVSLALLACLGAAQEIPTFKPGPAMADVEQLSFIDQFCRQLDKGQQAEAPELFQEQRTHGLSGRLVDRSGTAVAGILIGVRTWSQGQRPAHPLSWISKGGQALSWSKQRDFRSLALTAVDGSFTLRGLWPGVHELFTVSIDSQGETLFPVTPGQVQTAASGITITLDRPAPARSGGDELPRGQDQGEGRGLLQLTLVTPKGQPLSGPVCIGLKRLGPGTEDLPQTTAWKYGPVLRTPLAPGRYHVTVESKQRPKRCSAGWPLVPSSLLPTQFEVHIQPGKVSQALARLQPAGRLRLRLRDLPNATPVFDPPLDQDPSGACNRLASALRNEATPRRTRLWLSSESQAARRPLALRIPGCKSATSWYLLPGQETIVYDLLPPGSYQLHFELLGAHIPPCLIEIAHGRITDVRMALQPK